MKKSRKVHPAAAIFPMISGEAFNRLKEDIEENGQHEPVVLWKGMLLDGRNRLRACDELGIEPSECELDDDVDPVAYVVSANLHRRHLTPSQAAMCAAKLANLKHGSNQHTKKNEETPNGVSIDDAAKLFNVGTRSIDRAREVLSRGSKEVIEQCERGELPVSSAVKFIASVTDKREQSQVAKGGAGEVRAAIANPPLSHFDRFRKLWDSADSVGRAAIRAFILNS